MGSGSHSSKRKKKRSQKRSKRRSKTIKEKKIKKLKRRHDSVSCSDDDNSVTSSSVSCSDSSLEDNYRSRRRARYRHRSKSRRGSKKKIKRDSSMSDGSESSRRIKKRKRSKRKRDSDLRKKRHGKKRRRERSSSLSSGPSRSSSRSEPSNDSAGVERKEDDQQLKERDWEEKGTREIVGKRSRYSSRTCSPCSLQSESHSYGSEQRLMEDNPPKRLKSVIVVMKDIEELEIGESNREEHKDEIVYEHDDYPTRSNDSNDGMCRGEGMLNSHDASVQKTMHLEDSTREVGSSDARISKFSKLQKPDVEGTGGIPCSSIEFAVDKRSMGNRSVSTADPGSNFVDLEAMLRQKALQNLLKRQGKLPPKSNGVNKGDDSEKKNPNGGGSFVSSQKTGRDEYAEHTSSIPALSVDNLVHPPIRRPETGLPVEKSNASTNPVISRPKLEVSTSTRRLLGSSNTWRRDPTPQNSPRSNLPAPRDTVDKGFASKAIESQFPETKKVTEKADIVSSSELPPFGGKNYKTDEANEDAEFEQKTMTVMRGGELVQVSYKVKIPKKAPALARRQLKR